VANLRAETAKERGQEWRQKHPDYHRQWLAKHPGYFRRWVERNKKRVYAYQEEYRRTGQPPKKKVKADALLAKAHTSNQIEKAIEEVLDQ
jgi:hypothetical protein